MNKTITLGNDITVNRLGFGAMRVTGDGVWGDPKDHDEAIRLLKHVRALGVDFIDTADSYGPFVSEDLIREALHPYENVTIATKGGQTRPAPGRWVPLGAPHYLRQCVQMSLRRLAVEQIDLWQLHRIDPETDRNAQFAVIAEMQQEGWIRHVGLSEVSVEEIKAAREHFEVVSVQNLYNLVHRKSEDVLDYCEKEGIAFIPWYPLAAGKLAEEESILTDVARRMGAKPSQIALAWVLQRSEVMLPIPGTSRVEHLEENVAAGDITLSDADFEELDAVGRAEWARQSQ